MNLYLALSTIFLLLLGSCKEKKKTLIILEGHIGMFGYGSLMSKHFIESGLIKKAYDGLAHLSGFKRSWTFAWHTNIPRPYADGNYYKDYIVIENDTIYPQNLVYLNIKLDPTSTINGVLYIVPEADLPTYDVWELGYVRIDASASISDYTIEGGPVFAYKALPEFTLYPNTDLKQNIIEYSYTEIIQDAFKYWGKEFESEYKRTTEPLDSTIIQKNQKNIWKNPTLDKLNELKSSFKYCI